MTAGCCVERISQRSCYRCAIRQRFRDELDHLIMHLLELAECVFEIVRTIGAFGEIYPQSSVVVDNTPQPRPYWFFEQAGASVKVSRSVAIGYNHKSSLIVFDQRS